MDVKRGMTMTKLKVTYSVYLNEEKHSFRTFVDLNEQGASQELYSSLLLWEERVRKAAVIHSLSEELGLDSQKLLNVTINKKESNLY
jgi:cyanate lyase